MLFPLNGNQAGLYMRLSRDEDATRESNSIVNQRKILTDFASKNGFVVVDEYVDDGYSGANFRRPAFEKMLEDVRNGRIDVVIVKDLSRLGRDYIGTGEYMEKIFPRLGVRFIAIADGYDGRDNEDPSADMMPMINFFNEYHSKQTSKKTRASKKVMAQAGKFIGTKAPYGYILDPDDKHHLLIDPEAAKVVKAIFRYACSGLGYKAIVRRLRDRGVLNPTAYNNEKYPELYKSPYWKQPHDWHPSSVKTILTNPTYLGKVVSGRRRVLSFKTKEVVRMPEEMWTVVCDTHEPIITERVWREAQKKLAVRKRMDNQGAIQIFAGLVKCADCGYAMNYTGGSEKPRYQCSQYSVKGKSYCRSHYISFDELQRLVLEDIRRTAAEAARILDGRLDEVERAAERQAQQELAKKEAAWSKTRARVDKLEALITSIYEDKVTGKLSESRSLRLMAKYEDEQKEKRRLRDELEREMQVARERRQATEEFVRAIAAYRTLTGLNRTILNELIERIDIRTVNEAKQGVPRLSVTYKQNIFISDCLKQRQEVSGSIPLISTTKKTENTCFQSFFFCSNNFLRGYSLLGNVVKMGNCFLPGHERQQSHQNAKFTCDVRSKMV